jgi:uncharacterized membrane protein YraQ (UPF0718 family)
MSFDDKHDFAFTFLSILFEGAPFVLLGTLVSGFIDIYLPAGTMDRFLPRNKILATLVAGLMGIIFPVCECAVVPVIRRLVKKGLPVSCGLTYMLAAPIVNPITAASTWLAFKGQGGLMMTSARLLLGFSVAVGVGLIVSRMRLRSVLKSKLADSLEREPSIASDDDHGGCGSGDACCGHDHGPEAGSRVVAAFRSAMKDFVDVAVYFTIGVAITALFGIALARPGVRESVESIAANPAGAPIAMMALAFVLSLCSTTDAFIAANFQKFSWGAKLAFLTFGPMLDVKLLFLYQTVLRKRFIIWLAIGLFVSIGAASIAWQELILKTP